MSWLSLVPGLFGLLIALGWGLHVIVRMNAAPTTLNPLVIAELLNGRIGTARKLLQVAPGAPYTRMATAVLDTHEAHDGQAPRASMEAAVRAALTTERERLRVGETLQSYSGVLLLLTLIDAAWRWEGVIGAGLIAGLGFVIWRAMPRLLRRVLTVSEEECARLVDAALRADPLPP